MSDFLNSAYLMPALLVPGLVVLFVRSRFVTGGGAPQFVGILPYLTVSIVYYAIAYILVIPFANFADFIKWAHEPGYDKTAIVFALIFVGPAILGLLLGIDIQKNFSYRLLQRISLNPVHAVPTAWDWKFGRLGETYVLITLKDGTRFAGFFDSNSFVSSNANERDLYIRWIYDIEDEDEWVPVDGDGILIAADEIQTVEFLHRVTKKEKENEPK